ncbi:MAG: hypothetical protein A3E01_07735 [Gammaproteobacteria bacterium RIFCSPHIGHO2_12_FULL_63_22]|nr:MAG: hypothetical protein A3E01_07735 [Gammaproteobacteria bacterium RIFCSPHIGHO2_12_FULL_63_22]
MTPAGAIDEKWAQQCWYDLCRELAQLAYDRVGTKIVSGMAPGADTLGVQFAGSLDLPLHKFPADWDGLGKGAGPARNQQMAEFADVLVAFWDGYSNGTRDMIERALKRGLELHVYPYEPAEERF